MSLPDATTPVLAAAINSDPNPDKGLGDTMDTTDGTALLASSGPSGTIADVAGSAPSPDQISVYVVREGDTLSQIADMFDVSVNTIVWANDLGSDRAIQPGQTLIILPVSGTEHVVTKTDTLKSIAKKYGADANEIAEYNGIDPSVALAVGSTLIIPGGELAMPTPAPSSSSGGSAAASGTINEPYLGGSGPEIDGYFTNPLPGAILTQSIHGWNAVDLAMPKGTPIHAAASGTVIVAKANGAWNGGYGNYVVISDSNGTQTLYAHMSRVAATSGEGVSAGEVIGYVGATGYATGPHLHFEVRGAKNPFASCPLGASCQPQ
jgi:murein DD-endopeptidase MepM/ murein hydrolase activator NlpD